MQLIVVGVALEVIDGLLPIGGEDVLVLAVQALVDVGPCSCVQLGGRKAGSGQLGQGEVSSRDRVDGEGTWRVVDKPPCWHLVCCGVGQRGGRMRRETI